LQQQFSGGPNTAKRAQNQNQLNRFKESVGLHVGTKLLLLNSSMLDTADSQSEYEQPPICCTGTVLDKAAQAEGRDIHLGMNVLVAFWQGDDDNDVVFFVGQVRQLLPNRPRTKNKQLWLSVPGNCSDAAFFCHPWALVNEEGTLAVADELEEYYAVYSEGQVSIPVDSDDDDDDAEEDDVSERVVGASPIVTTGFFGGLDGSTSRDRCRNSYNISCSDVQKKRITAERSWIVAFVKVSARVT
jgi:hypothetical protein